MEKIYMENNSKQSKKKSSVTLSVVLTLVLALVTIVSIGSTMFRGVTYAADSTVTTAAPDKITLKASPVMVGQGASTNHPVPLMFATVGGKEYFTICIEADNGNLVAGDHTKGQPIDDQGLIYLLSYVANPDLKMSDKSGVVDTKVAAYVAQVAVWDYLVQNGVTNNTGQIKNDINNMNKDTQITIEVDNGSGAEQTVYGVEEGIYSLKVKDLTIKQLVENAMKIKKGEKTFNRTSLSITSKGDKVTMTSDNKYYQTELINVSVSNSSDDQMGAVNAYTILTEGLPEGSKLFGKDNVELTADKLKDLTNGLEFYVRVPVDKAKEIKDSSLIVKINENRTVAEAYKYTLGSNQARALVFPVTNNYLKNVNIKFNLEVPTDDTAANAAQSIYLIGLIVLLAGVGIIYANVKPKEASEI